MTAEQVLNAEQVKVFARDGFVKVPGFYDVERDIEPIRRAIYDLIGLVARRNRVPLQRPPYSPEDFDAGFNELIGLNRQYGAEVYDAVKCIPAFVRLAACARNEQVLQQLRPESFAGFIPRGYGIRIDIPGEDSFRAAWHQEYLYQLRSLDGLTLWSPLLSMRPELGPVIFCPGSHRDGVHPVREAVTNRPGAYAWAIENEAAVTSRYPQVAPLTEPGDLVILDFLVVHCSGFNRASRPRWSMQMRFFNFHEPSGLELGWKGSVADGVRVRDFFPELILPAKAGAA